MFLRLLQATGSGATTSKIAPSAPESLEIRLTLSATQLVVTFPPPTSVVAGEPFGLSVSAETLPAMWTPPSTAM